jgi:glycosyltransferase involved in cell wall biosynthesis
MSGILISFILPCLKVDSRYLRCVYAIVSSLENTNVSYEIIVVLPSAQLATNVDHHYPAVRHIPESKHGIYNAMNDGISASHGQYLYFLGQDDIVLPEFSNLISHALNQSYKCIIFDVYWGIDGLYRNKPCPFRLITRNLCHQGVIYSRSIFQLMGRYNTRFDTQADHFLNIKILWNSSLRSLCLYKPVPAAWYSGSGYSTLHNDTTFRSLYPLILKKYTRYPFFLMILLYRKLFAFIK